MVERNSRFSSRSSSRSTRMGFLSGLAAVPELFSSVMDVGPECLVLGAGSSGLCHRPDGASEFRQAVINRNAAQPLLVLDGGISADNLAVFYVIGNAALRGGNDAIANAAMAGHAHLPGQYHVVAHVGGSGETDLSTKQSIFANAGAVTDLHQVIDFR